MKNFNAITENRLQLIFADYQGLALIWLENGNTSLVKAAAFPKRTQKLHPMTPNKHNTKSLTGAVLAVALGSLSLQAASPPPVTARIGFGYSAPNATVGGAAFSGTPPTGWDYNQNRNVGASDLTALFGSSSISTVYTRNDGTGLLMGQTRETANFSPDLTTTLNLNNSFVAPNGVMGAAGTTVTPNAFFDAMDPFNVGNAFNTRLGVINGTLATTSYTALANLGIFSLSFEIAASRSGLNGGNPRLTPPINDTTSYAQVTADKRGGLGVQVGTRITTGTDAAIGSGVSTTAATMGQEINIEKLSVKLTHINGEQIIDGMTSSFMFQTDAVRLSSWNDVQPNLATPRYNYSGAIINGDAFGGPDTHNQAPLYTYAAPITDAVSVSASRAARDPLTRPDGTASGFDTFQLRAVHYTFKKIPDAGATLGMLGLGFAALVGVQRRLRR